MWLAVPGSRREKHPLWSEWPTTGAAGRTNICTFIPSTCWQVSSAVSTTFLHWDRKPRANTWCNTSLPPIIPMQCFRAEKCARAAHTCKLNSKSSLAGFFPLALYSPISGSSPENIILVRPVKILAGQQHQPPPPPSPILPQGRWQAQNSLIKKLMVYLTIYRSQSSASQTTGHLFILSK